MFLERLDIIQSMQDIRDLEEFCDLLCESCNHVIPSKVLCSPIVAISPVPFLRILIYVPKQNFRNRSTGTNQVGKDVG